MAKPHGGKHARHAPVEEHDDLDVFDPVLVKHKLTTVSRDEDDRNVLVVSYDNSDFQLRYERYLDGWAVRLSVTLSWVDDESCLRVRENVFRAEPSPREVAFWSMMEQKEFETRNKRMDQAKGILGATLRDLRSMMRE